MEGDRTHLEPPTLRVKKVQAQVLFLSNSNSAQRKHLVFLNTKLSLNAFKLMSFGFNQIKGEN